jgi:pimeloyl-ACP methyl ester carboxylesterase
MRVSIVSPCRFTTSDNMRIAYYVDDFTDPWSAPVVLLMLHSAMGHSRRFYAMVPPLARHFRVVRMDLRGHGGSEVPPADSPLTMQRLVQDAVELMDHLGCTRAHLVGNSAGGYVAQQLGMHHPARAITLSLFGSTPGLRNSQAAAWLPRIAREGLRDFLADTIADRFPATSNPGLIRWFLDEAAKNDVAYIARFIGLMTTLDWSGELDRIRCPTLVAIPGAETVGSVRNYQVMRERIPDVRVLSYEGMPHNICDADPARCAADVLQFIRERG